MSPELLNMIKKYNKLSLIYGIPGLLLQWLIILPNGVCKTIGLLATVSLIIGLSYHVKSIGWHPAWGLVGLFGLFGIIIVLCFKDKTETLAEKAAREKTRAKDIVLGVLFGFGLVVGVPLILIAIFNFFVK